MPAAQNLLAWNAPLSFSSGDHTIRVTALTADGRPAAIEARFAEPLESESYAWVIYTAGKYQPWIVPAIGETVITKDVKIPS